MGGAGSSSKRKSSKRKRDKKKKSRRKESKIRRRDYDSASPCSDDDSINSEDTSSFTLKSNRGRRKIQKKKLQCNSSLSSSADDQSLGSDFDSLSKHGHRHKHKKVRKSRVVLKSTKKRNRKRSCTSSDSDAGNARKRKRGARDVKLRKKSSKKRSRKHLGSSSSYDSESCSTCQSSSSSDYERSRNKVIIGEEKGRANGRDSNKSCYKHSVRSLSSSSFGQESADNVGLDVVDGAIRGVHNPRRLKSVIAVVDRHDDEEENRWEKDQHKEEIVYDREDYPSPKSMDSYEGAAMMEADDNSHGACSKRVCTDNIVGEEVVNVVDEGDQNNAGEPQSDVAHKWSFDKKEMDAHVPAAAAALGADDLESILRQKALENLRKFRGKLPAGPKSTNLRMTSNEGDVPARSVDEIGSKWIKPDNSRAPEMNSGNEPSLKSDLSHVNEVKKFPEDKLTENEHGMDNHTADGPAHLGCLKGDKGTDSQIVLSKHESRVDASPGAGATNACNSSTTQTTATAEAVTRDGSLDNQNDDKDGSQFEQRTMSVMRGGEMVQVSYKVYIPKKAPALARRQLRR